MGVRSSSTHTSRTYYTHVLKTSKFQCLLFNNSCLHSFACFKNIAFQTDFGWSNSAKLVSLTLLQNLATLGKITGRLGKEQNTSRRPEELLLEVRSYYCHHRYDVPVATFVQYDSQLFVSSGFWSPLLVTRLACIFLSRLFRCLVQCIAQGIAQCRTNEMKRISNKTEFAEKGTNRLSMDHHEITTRQQMRPGLTKQFDISQKRYVAKLVSPRNTSSANENPRGTRRAPFLKV